MLGGRDADDRGFKRVIGFQKAEASAHGQGLEQGGWTSPHTAQHSFSHG